MKLFIITLLVAAVSLELFWWKWSRKLIFLLSFFQRLQLNTLWRLVMTWPELVRNVSLNWVSQLRSLPNIRSVSSPVRESPRAISAAFSPVSVSSMTPRVSSLTAIWLNSEKAMMSVAALLDATTTRELTLACGHIAHSHASPRADSCQKDTKRLFNDFYLKCFKHTFFVFSLFLQ